MLSTYFCNLVALKRLKVISFQLVIVILLSNLPALAKKGKKSLDSGVGQANVSLWSSPVDIRHRNLFFGSGGRQDEPHTTFTFIKEDLDGSSPKFFVRDQNGTKWKIKVGPEARPETAATHLIWAVGYHVDEDYFMPTVRVRNLPAHLHRGQKWVGPGGVVHNARLEKYPKGRKKMGDWNWKANPFSGTRELDGLRVMMALINNWDLKNVNNSIYQESRPGAARSGRTLIYLVSDLGASFGSGGRSWTMAKSKDNLKAYRHSKFIGKAGPEYINFDNPQKPPLLFFLNLPEVFLRLQMRWVCRHIPRSHVQWIAEILAQLSETQVRDVFRASGYTPQEADAYTRIVEERIRQLNDL